MKILVCISKTPETTARIAFKNDDTELDRSGVQYIMNPYDEWYALVKALEIKEATGGTVEVVHVGLAENEPIMRKALAIGADSGIRVNRDPSGSMDVANQIAALDDIKSFDLIITGKETIEFNGSEVGSMLAEYLGWPFISHVSYMDVSANSLTVNRDVEGGQEVITVKIPCVISAAKGIAEQRIPNMRGIMMAKSKPVKVVDPAEFTSPIHLIKYHMPSSRSDCHYIDTEDMDELVKLLHEEAKVI